MLLGSEGPHPGLHKRGLAPATRGFRSQVRISHLGAFQNRLTVTLSTSIADIGPMREFSELAHYSARKDVVEQPFAFSMAFQPIVDVETETVYAYEALVRGPNGEAAGEMLEKVTRSNRDAFDQHCRIKAITLAASLDLAKTGARLSINVMPGAGHSAKDVVQLVVETAKRFNFPCAQLIFEISETENPRNEVRVCGMVDEYRCRGFLMAIDDFGVGYSGLSRLADASMDIIKIDMSLIRNLAQRKPAQTIVKFIVGLAKSLSCRVVAEGIETLEEYDAVRGCGVVLMQGYLFAKPGFEVLPQIMWPRTKRLAVAA